MQTPASNTPRPFRSLLKQATRREQRISWFGVAPYDSPPMLKEFIRVLNQYEEACRREDVEERQRLQRRVNEALDAYVNSNADGHVNPKWSIEMCRGVQARALGDPASYLDHSRRALGLADDAAPTQKARSWHNCAGANLRLGRYNDAIQCELQALELDSDNEGFWAHLAECYFRAGDLEAAREILAAVPDMSDLGKNSLWRLCLKHDQIFHTMAQQLPECRRLMDRIARDDSSAK